jgi:8-oxo-dGTP pyrophosphatase MutT (NUDIX family)
MRITIGGLRRLLHRHLAEAPARRWGRRGVGAVFVHPGSKSIGLALRSGRVKEPGTYGTVGGAIDQGEDASTGLAREVKEELGFGLSRARSVEPLDTFSEQGFEYTTYAVVVDKRFAPRLNHENDSFDWFSLDKLPPNLHFGIASSLGKKAVLDHLARLMGD